MVFHSETLDGILPTLNAVSSDNAARRKSTVVAVLVVSDRFSKSSTVQKEKIPPDMKRKPDLFQTLRAYATWRRLSAAVIVTGVSIVSGTVGAGDFYLRAGIGFDGIVRLTCSEQQSQQSRSLRLQVDATRPKRRSD